MEMSFSLKNKQVKQLMPESKSANLRARLCCPCSMGTRTTQTSAEKHGLA